VVVGCPPSSLVVPRRRWLSLSSLVVPVIVGRVPSSWVVPCRPGWSSPAVGGSPSSLVGCPSLLAAPRGRGSSPSLWVVLLRCGRSPVSFIPHRHRPVSPAVVLAPPSLCVLPRRR